VRTPTCRPSGKLTVGEKRTDVLFVARGLKPPADLFVPVASPLPVRLG